LDCELGERWERKGEKEGNGRDYTRDHHYKEILGRTSFLEVYFRNSKCMAKA
jgi:hypothetical protein